MLVNIDNKINVLQNNKPVDSHQTVKTNVIIAKGDSGASSNYWREEDKQILRNLQPNSTINVTLPNNDPIKSTSNGTIPLSNMLSSKAKLATVLPNLKSSSLISLGQLCDDNCTVLLDKKKLNVYKNNQVVLKGYRNPNDGLWDIPIVSNITPDNYLMPPTHSAMYSSRCNNAKSSPSINKKHRKVTVKRSKTLSDTIDCTIQELEKIITDTSNLNQKVNVIIRKKQSKRELVQYLHATCLSPTISTFIAAIQKNNFSSWPRLTKNLIIKHLLKSAYTY